MNLEPRDALLIRAERAYRDVVADPRKARPLAEAIADEARRAGAHEALTIALRAAGWAARELYDHTAARRLLNEATHVARRNGLDDRLCEALITRSATYLEMGQPGRARRDLRVAQERAGPRSQAEVAFAQGLLEDIAGNLEQAVEAYQRTLQSCPDDRPDLRFKALNNLGLILLRLGRYRQADERLAEAAALADTFSPAFAGHVAESRATLAIERGQPIEALRRYRRAEELLTKVGVQLADLYIGKAHALLQLQLLDEAAEAAAMAVRHVEGRVGGSLMLAEALLPQARIALARGRLEEAITVASRAEDLLRRQRRSGWRAQAALLRLQAQWRSGTASLAMADNLARIERTMRHVGSVAAVTEAALLHGRVAAALGRRRRAVAAFDRASAAARGPVLLRLQGRLAEALKADLLGDTRRLSRVCRVGLEEVSAYRATFASAELRARAAAHGAALADLGLRQAMRAGRPEHVWSWLERARAVVTVRDGQHEGADELQPLLAQLRGLERDLRETSPDDAATQAALMRQITRLERQIRDHTRTRRAFEATIIMPSLAALRALRADLGDRAILQMGVIDGHVVGVSVTRDRLELADLGAVGTVRAAGQQFAFAIRRLGQPRSPAATAAALHSARRELQRLDATLMAPFASTLRRSGEVIVAPPAELIGIPWGSLPHLADRPVRVTPSATMWRLTHQRAVPSERVVLVAGPDVPTATSELAAIAQCYPDAEQLVDGAATSDAVRHAASGARIIHIACHGRLRSDSAAFSSLRMSDGPLTVQDLEQLAKPAHHWVLAACNMGHPGQLAGPELDGVIATLLHGGAAGVVAAITSVPDLETREVMTALHRELAAGASLSDAVCRARQHVDADDPQGFVAGVAFSCYGGG